MSARTPSFVAGGGARAPYSNDRQLERFRDRAPPETRRSEYPRNDGLGGFVVAANPNEPEFGSLEEAEAAFMKLLKRSGVKPDWTWDQAMRATIKDPQYRGIKDPKDRKKAFEKFVQEARVQEREKEKERLAKLRTDFTNMLQSHPEIQHYTRWKTARPIIEGETIFRSSSNETEKRQLFEGYIIQLRKQHSEQEEQNRKAALGDITSILQSFRLEPDARWHDAREMLAENERFKADAKFQTLSKLDILNSFKSHIMSVEQSYNEQKQREKSQKYRKERQNRDQYTGTLADLHRAGKIKASTKWMDIRPLVEENPAYLAMLGQHGSTPLELFWDVVEEEETLLRRKRNEAADVLQDVGIDIRGESDRQTFIKAMRRDQRTQALDEAEVNLIFERLLAKSTQLLAKDKEEQEYRYRREIDALRSKIKHLHPPVRATDTWEEVRPLVEELEEFAAVPTDALRRVAFDKVIRRLDERDDYDRRSGRRERDRDSHRDSHRSNGRSRRDHSRERTSSRARETDPYEADRRQAQADREKSYRRSGGGRTGLSPLPRSERGERTRDRYEDRSGRLSERRGSTSGGYDRERRERDVERERLYASRADPRDLGVRALDYDEGASGGRRGSTVSDKSAARKRRDSDTGDRGERTDSKRAKRDHGAKDDASLASAQEQAAKEEKEDEVLKSGSEEGEIEED